MAEVDSKIPSPQKRAEIIFAKLKETLPGLSVWDTICFAAEYLGSQVSTLPFLEEPVKRLAMMVYAYHYQYPESVDTTYPKQEDEQSRSGAGNTSTGVSETGTSKS